MRKYKASFDDVLRFVKARANFRPSKKITRQLHVWHEVRYEIWEDEDETIPKPSSREYLDYLLTALKRWAYGE
jgi:hypothetical protein